MTPVLLTPAPAVSPASPGLIRAAMIVRDAAGLLAEESWMAHDAARYLRAAGRLTAVLRPSRVGRRRLLLASPALTERSGRVRTLVEMIASEPDDDAHRLRLAKHPFRALIWRPETFPPTQG